MARYNSLPPSPPPVVLIASSPIGSAAHRLATKSPPSRTCELKRTHPSIRRNTNQAEAVGVEEAIGHTHAHTSSCEICTRIIRMEISIDAHSSILCSSR